MNVVGHDSEGVQFVVAQFRAPMYGVHHDPGDGFLPQEGRPMPRAIQAAVNPRKGLATEELTRRVRRGRQAAGCRPAARRA